MKTFTEHLEEAYSDFLEYTDYPENRLIWVADNIFEFVTYDSGASEVFGNLMLRVLKPILNQTTFDFQKESEDNYYTFLLMVNMPFLKDKLEWGTSIRGAWFDTSGDSILELDCGRVMVPMKDFKEFVKELLDWIEVNN